MEIRRQGSWLINRMKKEAYESLSIMGVQLLDDCLGWQLTVVYQGVFISLQNINPKAFNDLS